MFSNLICCGDATQAFTIYKDYPDLMKDLFKVVLDHKNQLKVVNVCFDIIVKMCEWDIEL